MYLPPEKGLVHHYDFTITSLIQYISNLDELKVGTVDCMTSTIEILIQRYQFMLLE